jgi:hypothetical protein
MEATEKASFPHAVRTLSAPSLAGLPLWKLERSEPIPGGICAGVAWLGGFATLMSGSCQGQFKLVAVDQCDAPLRDFEANLPYHN